MAEKILLQVIKGALVPADGLSASLLREKGYQIGDLLSATLTKPRNPAFHRLAHALGRLVAENVDDFSGMDPHSTLKRLQVEANVGCEPIYVRMPGLGPAEIRQARSLSFASMDEGEFKTVIRGICRHIAKQYWGGLTPEQIEEMAEVMVHE